MQLPFSGSSAAFAACEPVLRELGTVTHHGEDAGLAAVEFLAQIAVSYELLIGYLHTLRLVQAEGVDVVEFAGRVGASLPAYPPLLTSMAQAVKNGDYGPDLGPLTVQAALMDDLIGHRHAAGVEAVRMREVKRLMDRRIAGGHGDQGFSSLFRAAGRAHRHVTRPELTERYFRESPGSRRTYIHVREHGSFSRQLRRRREPGPGSRRPSSPRGGEQVYGVLHGLHTVAAFGHDQQVAGQPVPRVRSGDEPYPPVQHVHRDLARMLVFVHVLALPQCHHGLPQRTIVSTVDSGGAPTAARLTGTREQIVNERGQ
ncbi:hypothetical protein [Nonomuraea salmonea]|uniref:imine reductase family protein n=1 Tax=Nonomuraea salmonea TaxID=46181 RepID=UPI003CD095E5